MKIYMCVNGGHDVSIEAWMMGDSLLQYSLVSLRVRNNTAREHVVWPVDALAYYILTLFMPRTYT